MRHFIQMLRVHFRQEGRSGIPCYRSSSIGLEHATLLGFPRTFITKPYKGKHKTAATKSGRNKPIANGSTRLQKAMAIRFDDRVALVTGAGGGLGREYALLLAKRGAKVVVNDLGGSRSGEGGDSRPADQVVAEIKAMGGQAVPNYDSVEDGEKLVQTALDNFGRIDIVINNAGILRDRSFVKLAHQDWNLIQRVHLWGAFRVTQAAWPHMKRNNYGRIIMTSSVAGVFGNFGQANYSSAKLGLIGLAKTLAIEGERCGIQCNVILPMAASRLTQDILPPDVFDSLSPEHIAPVVCWMCHEDCGENGAVIEAAGGWAGKYRWERGAGSICLDPELATVSLEAVRDKWDKITDLTETEHPETNQEATMNLVGRIKDAVDAIAERKNASGRSAAAKSSSPSDAVGYTSQPIQFAYNFKDVILYALGVGASTQNSHGLQYLYEGHDSFSALPSYGVIPALVCLEELVMGKIPGLENVDLTRVLHGEQHLEVVAGELPTAANLTNTFTIQDVLDKGSGMVILALIESKDESGELVMRNQVSTFVVGAGGFGGPRSSDKIIPVAKLPSESRSPDHTARYRTSVDQAALYRLSGDLNPLHIDPQFAAVGGFKTPILHGLCTMGIAVRCIADQWCDGNANRIRELKVRFSKPVLPGHTVLTDTWRQGKDKILFRVRVEETDETCITGGWVRLASSDLSKL